MSDLDSNSSYESYSSDSGSSKSLPTPCELVLKRNIINQCEEIKNKFEKEQTGSAVVNNESREFWSKARVKYRELYLLNLK